MSRRKISPSNREEKVAPYDRFSNFLHYIAQRASKKPNEQEMGQRPHIVGMNNNVMLTNIFISFTS